MKKKLLKTFEAETNKFVVPKRIKPFQYSNKYLLVKHERNIPYIIETTSVLMMRLPSILTHTRTAPAGHKHHNLHNRFSNFCGTKQNPCAFRK